MVGGVYHSKEQGQSQAAFEKTKPKFVFGELSA